MPKLVRLYIVQSAIGFAIAAAFVAMLLAFNVANLWHLVTNSSVGLLAVTLLWLFNGIVFSGVQFGIAIMRMAEPEPRDPGNRLGVRLRSALSALPVQVRNAPKQRDGKTTALRQI